MNTRHLRMALGAVLSLGLLGMIPGVALAAQPSCGDTLMANTTLTHNLDCSSYSGDALTFGKAHITLNLNGHTITGPTGDDYDDGVETAGYNFVTVTNGTFSGFGYAIDNEGSSSSTFSWLTINGEIQSDDYGVYESYGAGNTYNHLNVDGMNIGMYLSYGASNTVKNSSFEATAEDVYLYYESTDAVTNVKAKGTGYGFYDYDSSHSRYVGNVANGHASEGFYVYCDDYGAVTLINNTANHNGGDGFYLYYCYDDNNEANGATVKGNVANYNDANGFEDDYSLSSTWTYNYAGHNGDDGFYMDYPGIDVIRYNVAVSNSDDGFDLVDADGSGYEGPADFSWNRATYNTDSGFTADYGVPGQANRARHNGTNCYDVVCI